MKRLLSILLLPALLAGRGALAQPSPSYVNISPLTFPPQVDALAFTNLSSINMALGTGLWDASDVLEWVNRGTMSVDTGYIFDDAPSGAPGFGGPRRMSDNFMNQNPGIISAGSSAASITTNGVTVIVTSVATVAPQIRISATNVMNTGVLDVGSGGVISIEGNSVNLARGLVNHETTSAAVSGGTCEVGGLAVPNFFDFYWGVGRATNVGADFTLATATTGEHNVTSQTGPLQLYAFSLLNAIGSANTLQVSPTNTTTQVVLLGLPLGGGIQTDIRWMYCTTNAAVPVIQWQAVITNNLTRALITNSIFLEDFFLSFTNFQTATNASTSGSGASTQEPVNYQFATTFTGATVPYAGLSQGNTPYDPTLVASGVGITNEATGYAVTLSPATFLPDPGVPGATYSNMQGRIEITANSALDLTLARLVGANFLSLTATNHFVGSSNASITAPFASYNLAVTNGSLMISNLVSPTQPKYSGEIQMWSCRWTNFTTNVSMTISNTLATNRVENLFHALMVDSSTLSPIAPALIQDFQLKSASPVGGTNAPGSIYISDTVNVLSTLALNASRLTITSNGPAATTPYGQLNLQNAGLLWSPNLPFLQYLTNWGIISVPNTAFFQTRANPVQPLPSDAPYQSLVNHGEITFEGATFWANYFENTGPGFLAPGVGFPTSLIESGQGPISVTASNAVLGNTELSASAGDLAILSGSLTVTNTTLLTSQKLTLAGTNLTTDGGTVGNSWQVGDGVNVPVNPANGDLLGTTLTSDTAAFQNVTHVWAGRDLGNSAAGFLNNLALGHLILDGGDANSTFTFAGPDNVNRYAIYVDQLELRDFATNRANPNFIELNIATNMTVYFADAVIGSGDISEKMNGANGGRLVWVSSFNSGLFSSTNLTYPDGKTFSFNRALVTSLDLDSDGDGIPNRLDSTPILEPSTLVISVAMANSVAQVSWVSPANASNYLYRSTNFASGNWTLVTNFTQGNISGQVTVPDAGGKNGPTYYQVQVVTH